MDAVILAAGKGTRFKTATSKVLAPLFGKPLLHRVLTLLEALPVTRAQLVVGHQREQVQAAVRQWDFPFEVQFAVQEPQLGTGHALMQANPTADTVLVLSGDVPLLRPETLKLLLSEHQASGADMTLLMAHLQNPTGYGRVITQDGRVRRIVEEADASTEEKVVQQVNTGIYCLNWPRIAPLLSRLSSQNAHGELYLTDLVALAHHVHAVDLWDSDEMLGVNSRQDLAQCHSVLKQRTQDRLMAEGVTLIDPDSTWVSPEVTLGADTIVYPGCYLAGDITSGTACEIGPHTVMLGRVQLGDRVQVLQSRLSDVTLGDDTRVGPFAHLRDGVDVAHHVRIGNFVEVKNSDIGPNTNAAHLAYVGDATLGAEVNMGAGAITANYDPVRKQKHRTVIGDGVKVGCNSVLVAPVTVGEHASVAAGSVITKPVSAWSLAIARGRQTELPDWVRRVQQENALPG
jgi:bifunctional UDP-N-acetylglucosamine pyrophosphorylase/glucosamine-1-phosphate N-acetyltransferase